MILASLILRPFSDAWAVPMCSDDDKPEIVTFDAYDSNHKLRDQSKENLCNQPIEAQTEFLYYAVKHGPGGADVNRATIKHIGSFIDGPDKAKTQH